MTLRAFAGWIIASMLASSLACSSSTSPTTAGSTTSSGATGGAGGEIGYGGKGSWEVELALGGGASAGGGGAGGCPFAVYEPPVVSSPHVEMCSVVEYLSNPPTSGPHYPKWAQFQSYSTPIPWGFLVHAMEHGAVVIAHRCTSCPEIAEIQAFVEAEPADPACVAPVEKRLIVVPAPDLDAPFALSAWGAMLEADCFDPKVAEAFIAKYYAKGPEDVCASGIDPTDPAQMIPADCGQ